MPPFEVIATPPVIYVAGVSTPNLAAIERYIADVGDGWNRVSGDAPDDPEALLEAAGRLCYASWNNPAKKTRQQYICSSIIEHAHGSVLEHVWINLIIRDLPRSSQLELVRHGEGTAFSFESTRFTDKRLRFIIPPRLRGHDQLETAFREHCEGLVADYVRLRDSLSLPHEEGTLKRKRAKEMARSVLPNALGSDGMVSVNARSVRWIIQSRSDLHADSSLREFAYALYQTVQPILPSVFSDAVVTPTEDGIPNVAFTVPKV